MSSSGVDDTMTDGDDPAGAGANGKRRKRKPKERFVARMRRRGREAYGLGATLVNEPRAFPAQAGGLLKRSFRTMWAARGGGFYASGFVVTFVWLEFRTLLGEIVASDGIGSFFSEQLLEFLLRFSLQSLGNTLQALIWPVLVVARWEAWGVAALLAGALLFGRLLKAPLTDWLFDGEPPEDEGSAPDDATR